MCYNDDRLSLFVQFLHNIKDIIAVVSVQTAGRLICENQLRIFYDDLCKRNALLFAAA